MQIAPGQGQTAPMGQSLDVNKNFLSLHSFVASLKKNVFEVWFDTLLHVYSRWQGQTAPRGQIWCQQKRIITSPICCKFQRNLFAWRPSWSCDQDRLNKISFPHPMETPYEIWLQSAEWFLRCLKSVDDIRQTDGRRRPTYPISSPSAQVTFEILKPTSRRQKTDHIR